MYKVLSWFCLCVICVSCKTTPDYGDLREHLKNIADTSGFNGVILLKQDDKTIFSTVRGYSNIEGSIPLKQNDHFVIGSVSKQITATLVLREVEKGHIHLDDQIGEFLPHIVQPWKDQITIHHLLTHTHGIVDINQPTQFNAGSQFRYSQLGYGLLAQILEQVSGKSFTTLTTELFKELHLTNTFHPDHKSKTNLVIGYEEIAPDSLIQSTNSLRNYAAAGSIVSNANDLIIWNRLLHSGRIVNPKTLELMKTKFATREHPIFDQIDYGYGLLFNEGEENLEIGALGYAPGFVTACYYYPKTNLNLVVLQNTALHLNDFKHTFKVQTECMKMVKAFSY